MKKLSPSILGFLFAIVAVLVLGFVVGTSVPKVDDFSLSSNSAVTTEEVTASVAIDYGNGEVNAFPNVALDDNDNLADILLDLHEEGKVDLSYKDYGGEMGIFISTIDGVGSGESNAWWQYWVNGRYGEVGISSQPISSGDSVLFVFGGSKN